MLLNELLSDSQHIPPFIDTKLKRDVTVWRLMQSVYASIIQLIAPSFLSIYQIELIDFDIQSDMADIIELIDTRQQNLVITYFSEKFDHYNKRSIQLELFEAAQNIKTYLSL